MVTQEEILMRFNELAQDVDEDEYGKWDIDDTRRPKLTLKHINKMRKMQELRKTEHTKEVEEYRKMYSQGGGE